MKPEHIHMLPPPLSEAATAVAEARERGRLVDADDLRRRIEAMMAEVRAAKRNHRFGTPDYSPMVLSCLDNRVFGYEDVLGVLDEMEGK